MLRSVFFFLFSITFFAESTAQVATWDSITTSNQAIGREEGSFVVAGDKFILIGGRIFKPTQSFSLLDSTWSTFSAPPLEIHHFQAINYHNLVLIIGALTGGFPNETPVDRVWIYNPVNDTWIQGRDIPIARQRGSAGAVLHKGKVYVVGGITGGHLSGWQKQFDVYDPATGSWTVLQDAPQERDHFQVMISQDRLYAAGGRMSGAGISIIDSTIAQVDYYDLATQQWTTLSSLSNIPTERAGCAAALVNGNVMICGGESIDQGPAHDECEILNTTTHLWTPADNMVLGRHGTQIGSMGNFHFIAAGVGYQGGGPRWGSIEVYSDSTDALTIPAAITSATFTITSCEKFEGIDVGDSLLKTIELSHESGNQAILIDSIKILNASDFELLNSFDYPIFLAPDSLLNIDLKFTRSDSNFVNDELRVYLSVPDDTVITVKLTAPFDGYPVINISNSEACSGDTVSLWTNNVFETYSWSTGSIDTITEVYNAGNIMLSVTDEQNCSYENALNVDYNPFLGIVSSKQLIRCKGSSDGRITVNGFGGTSPYTYLWNDSLSSTTKSIANLGPGTYSVVVTDDSGCTVEGSFVFTEPNELFLVYILDSPQPGDVNLLVSGGVNPYRYEWSTGETTQDLTNVTP
ncbi:MAG: hypothetical protein HKN22_05290, partial [Bacteroidia bacterium]|nr:hypothetical protein [Bacteroidia bacterium]